MSVLTSDRAFISRVLQFIPFLLAIGFLAIALYSPAQQVSARSPAANENPPQKPASAPANAAARSQGATTASSPNQPAANPDAPPTGSRPQPAPSPQDQKPNGQSADTTNAGNKTDVGKDHSPQILAWLSVTKDEEKNLPLGSRTAYGSLLFLLGAVGALITAFYSVGDALPGIGGGGLVEPQVAQMKAFENAARLTSNNLAEVQEKLKACDQSEDPRCVESLRFVAGQYVEEMKLYEKHMARLRDLVNRNQWRIYSYGMPMYVVIGGATSMLFARDWLQAILFGYSWASVVSTIGLKGTVSQKSTAASQQGEQIDERVKRLQQEKKAMEAQTSTLSATLALAVKQIQGQAK